MPLFQTTIGAATLCVTLLTGAFALAQETAGSTANPDQVLVTVNGTDITLGHVIALRADLPAQYDQFPSALLFQGILDQLVRQTLLMQSHEGELSRQGRLFLENEERAIYASEVTEAVSGAAIEDETLKKLYEEQYAAGEQKTEYRASHILLETEEKADEMITLLDGGADFAELAREHSTGPSNAVGGDLGWFGEGDLVAEFFEAVLALEPGGVSPPVESEFGWHVIKLAETRVAEAPQFAAIKDQLAEELRQSRIDAHVDELTGKAMIERADLSAFNPDTITQYDLLGN